MRKIKRVFEVASNEEALGAKRIVEEIAKEFEGTTIGNIVYCEQDKSYNLFYSLPETFYRRYDEPKQNLSRGVKKEIHDAVKGEVDIVGMKDGFKDKIDRLQKQIDKIEGYLVDRHATMADITVKEAKRRWDESSWPN